MKKEVIMQKQNKTQKLSIRINEAEKVAIEKAVEKYHRKTGARKTISGYIRHVTKQYLSDAK